MLKLMIFVVLGAMIVLMLSLNEALAKPGFKWSKFIKQNLLTTLLNIMIGCTIVYSEFDSVDPLYPLTNTTALMLGAAAQVIFRKLITIFTTEKSTFVGTKE
jgi:hypothetical protein